MEEKKNIRLNKYIAASGICSRRKADELISQGLIKVNDKIVTSLGEKISEYDKVFYQDKLINPEKPVYILLNKPKDYLTTVDDNRKRKTVLHLIGKRKERVYPVGRLDRSTTGLLLLTNDGELTKKLTHPSEKIPKVYEVKLNKPFSEKDFENLKKGIQLEDGWVEIDDLAYPEKDNHYKIGIEIHSGKNRVIRRIFDKLNYDVKSLDRVLFAQLTKKDLPRGKWRYLEEKELRWLKKLTNSS